MNAITTVAWWLVVIGAINWGLTAFGFNLVETLFGSWPTVVQVVYIVVGLSALWLLYDKFMGKQA